MEKNEGKEKKIGRKWYYTTGGKRFRGFLCMLTFAVFLISAELVFLAWNYFGEDIFPIRSKDYHETIRYSNDVATEYSTLLAAIDTLENEKNRNELCIINTASNEIDDYDLQDLKSYDPEGALPDSLEGIEKYIVNSEDIQVNFQNPLYNYSQMLRLLATGSGKNSYLYFSKGGFKNLFLYYGTQNTNHRYSPEFSEKAYFIFKTKKVWGGTDENEAVIEVRVSMSGEPETSESTNVMFETYDSEDDTVKSYESLNDAMAGGEEYAVYDPEEDVYYSTMDNYFEPYDSYLYDCSEVLSALDQHTGYERNRLDNIVLPLLWSENKSMQSVLEEKTGDSDAEAAAAELKAMKNGAFVYYVTCRDFTYKNVDSIEEITSLPYSYCIERGVSNTQAEKAQKTVESLDMDNHFEDVLVNCFPNRYMLVCFGVDYDRVAANVTERDELLQTPSYMNYRIYSEVIDYINPMSVAAVVSLILLIFQAVSLILTTGRQGKKNVEQGTNLEITLNAYDNLPTELWLLVTVLVMGICIVPLIFGVGVYVDLNHFDQSILESILPSAACIMPFGFFLMEFTLSFARRVKAKNLSSKSRHYLKRGFRWCRAKVSGLYRKCTHFYYRQNGVKRLWLLFLVYLGVLLVCLLALVYWGQYGAMVSGKLKGFSNNAVSVAVLFLIVIIIVLHVGSFIIIRRLCRDLKQLIQCVEDITKGELDSKCELKTKNSFFNELANGINHIGDGLKAAVETSIKDERMKTELITNVSHDLKTPLTSIINYVDLLKKEEMPSEDARHYLEVLDTKSQRLKQLTEDLVEAAKANSGSIELTCMPLAFDELMRQAIGEFEDKFAKRDLTVVAAYPEQPTVIMADGRRLFRVLENVLQNAYKYALAGTRIYADLSNNMGEAVFTLKNVSAAQLNISPQELMERFTRGDAARTTEGSGLGLSIAKDLTHLMEGTFEIQLDGDLFKVILRFPEYEKTE